MNSISPRSFRFLLAAACVLPAMVGIVRATDHSPLKVGIIGCDAHALPWTKIINATDASGELADITVVAAYAGGSDDIPQSIQIRDNSVEAIAALGVEMVHSINELIKKVDCVMILSIDGRKHLDQVRPVVAAGKPVFVDKPIAGSLVGAIQIFRLAKEHKVPCFSSSSLRFASRTLNVGKDPTWQLVFGKTVESARFVVSARLSEATGQRCSEPRGMFRAVALMAMNH